MSDRIATTLPFTELEVADGNFDTSRTTIDRIVIHTMVGTWEAAAARFDQYGTQVSSHYGVKLDGSLIHWLEETSTAYHAGNYDMNQRSVGIEHEDGGDYNGIRPDVLYTESAKLVRDICQFYNIPIDREHILKHSEVIPTGCPDALDIDRIVREAAVEPNVAVPSSKFTELVDKSTKYDAFNAAGYKTVDDVNQKVTDLQNQLTACLNKPITGQTVPSVATTSTTSQGTSTTTSTVLIDNPVVNVASDNLVVPNNVEVPITPPDQSNQQPKNQFLAWFNNFISYIFKTK